MRVETMNCLEQGHPGFVLEVADEQIPVVYVNAFIQTLESNGGLLLSFQSRHLDELWKQSKG